MVTFREVEGEEGDVDPLSRERGDYPGAPVGPQVTVQRHRARDVTMGTTQLQGVMATTLLVISTSN